MAYEDYTYSSNPKIEELMIERNGDADYLRELAAEHFDPCAGFEDYTDEEMADAQESYDAALFDLTEDIPF